MANTKESGKSCKGSKKAMALYGLIQLGTSVASAIALVSIAISLNSYNLQNFNNMESSNNNEIKSIKHIV